MDVNELEKMIPGGWGGAAIGAAASVVSFFVYIRKYMSGDAVERGNNSAHLNAIATYKDLLEGAEARCAAAVARADNFAREKNEAMVIVAGMQTQIALLSMKLDNQTIEIAGLREQVQTFQEKHNAS